MPFRQLKHSVTLSNNPLICGKNKTLMPIFTLLSKRLDLKPFFNFMENVKC